MLFQLQLPIKLLSNAPKFLYYALITLHCALLCSIMLYKVIKFLLPESENKLIFLNYAILDNYLTVLLEYQHISINF